MAKAPVAVVATIRQTARSAANMRFQSLVFIVDLSFSANKSTTTGRFRSTTSVTKQWTVYRQKRKSDFRKANPVISHKDYAHFLLTLHVPFFLSNR